METKQNQLQHLGKPSIDFDKNTGLHTITRRYIGKSHLTRPINTSGSCPSIGDGEIPFGEVDPEYNNEKGAEFEAYLVDQSIQDGTDKVVVTRVYMELKAEGTLTPYKSDNVTNNKSGQKIIQKTFIVRNPYGSSSSNIGVESATNGGDTGFLYNEKITHQNQIFSIVTKDYYVPAILDKGVDWKDNLKYETITYMSPDRRPDWEFSGITVDVKESDPSGYGTFTVTKITNAGNRTKFNEYSKYIDFYVAGVLTYDDNYGFLANKGDTRKVRAKVKEYITTSNNPDNITETINVKSWGGGSYKFSRDGESTYNTMSATGCLASSKPIKVGKVVDDDGDGVSSVINIDVSLGSNPTLEQWNSLAGRTVTIDSQVDPFLNDHDNGQLYFKKVTTTITLPRAESGSAISGSSTSSTARRESFTRRLGS